MIPPQKPQTQIHLERAPADTPWAVRVHPSLGCPAQALERDYWISAYGGPGQLRPPSGTCSPGRHSEQETSTASSGEAGSADNAEWGALHRLPAALGMEPTWKAGRVPALSGLPLPQNRASLQLGSQLEVSSVTCNTAALTDTCLNVNSECQPSAVGRTYLPVHNLCSILKMGTLMPSQGKATCPGSQGSFLKARCPLCGAESRCKQGRSQGLHFRLPQSAAWRRSGLNVPGAF